MVLVDFMCLCVPVDFWQDYGVVVMREKLIELIASKVCDTYSEAFEEWLPHDCGKCYANNCHIAEIADYLIANGVTVQKWIPVTERLPQRNAEVLVCDTREDYVSVWEYMGEGLWFGNDVIWATEDITHWMPLPEAPKEGVDNGQA
jgi:hypothetical protein